MVTDREALRELEPAAVRAAIGDGSYGGPYAVPDEDALRVWSAGVAEVAGADRVAVARLGARAAAPSQPPLLPPARGRGGISASPRIAAGHVPGQPLAERAAADRLRRGRHPDRADRRVVGVAREQVGEPALDQPQAALLRRVGRSARRPTRRSPGRARPTRRAGTSRSGCGLHLGVPLGVGEHRRESLRRAARTARRASPSGQP